MLRLSATPGAFCRNDLFWANVCQQGRYNAFQALMCVVRVVLLVVNLPAVFLQLLRKVAHGAEQKNQLLLVMVGVTGFLMDLSHHDPVATGVSPVKSADIGCQLVTKDQYQVCHEG
jgi:hypothetical protein